MNTTAYNLVRSALETNPDREYTTEQMRRHLRKYAHGTISIALKRLHDNGVAERVRDGNEPYRYSLANTI